MRDATCPRCHEAVSVAAAVDGARAPFVLCANPACQAALTWATGRDGGWRIDTDFEARRSYLRFYRQHAHAR